MTDRLNPHILSTKRSDDIYFFQAVVHIDLSQSVSDDVDKDGASLDVQVCSQGPNDECVNGKIFFILAQRFMLASVSVE